MRRRLRGPKRKRANQGVEALPMMELLLRDKPINVKKLLQHNRDALSPEELSGEAREIRREFYRRCGYDPDNLPQLIWPSREAREEWEVSPEGQRELAKQKRREAEYAAYRRSKGYPD